MANKEKHQPKRVVNMLCQIEVIVVNGRSTDKPFLDPALLSRASASGLTSVVVCR